MPFGKHKDKPINEIDTHYLEWVLANCQQISPDLKRAICTQLGLEFKDDPKDKEIAELQASNQELRHKNLVSTLEAYDQGYEDGKREPCEQGQGMASIAGTRLSGIDRSAHGCERRR